MQSKVIISHRGNLNGPEETYENQPFAIDRAIELGFHVEVDVWGKDGKLFLGHDNPASPIEVSFLSDRSSFLWIHCKNGEALSVFIDYTFNYFFHQKDFHVLTSKGFIWSRPENYLFCQNEILVLPERIFDWKKDQWRPISNNFHGICTDYPLGYSKLLNKPKVDLL
jgi:hypothetical protein